MRNKGSREVGIRYCTQISFKVPSGQIRSAWERYYWIGLEKDINRYKFLIFLNFRFEKLNYKWTSAASVRDKYQKYATFPPPPLLITV